MHNVSIVIIRKRSVLSSTDGQWIQLIECEPSAVRLVSTQLILYELTLE